MATLISNTTKYVINKAYDITPQMALDTFEWLCEYIYEWKKYNYFVSTVTSKYLTSKFWNICWWHNINEHIILGAIPLHNANHLEQLNQEKIGAVLSILEDFEMIPTLYLHPISAEDWIDNNIKFMQVKVPDGSKVPLGDIKKCISYLSENVENHRKCYVHCKAGRGRSASIVLCYMLYNLHKKEIVITKSDIQKTYEYLISIRNEVNISEIQFASIYEYIESLNNDV